MYAVFQSGDKPYRQKHVNVGTLGHVDYGKAILRAAIDDGKPSRNKSDRKRGRKNRWS